MWLTLLEIYVSNIHKRIQCKGMNTILNMMSELYNFVIEPFLLPNNFNTKILNQLIFTVVVVVVVVVVNYEKFVNNHHTNS